MIIQLTMSIPIDAKHGLVFGRELRVIREHRDAPRGAPRWVVLSNLDEEVGIKEYEARVVFNKGTLVMGA